MGLRRHPRRPRQREQQDRDLSCPVCGAELLDEDDLWIHQEDCESMALEETEDEW